MEEEKIFTFNSWDTFAEDFIKWYDLGKPEFTIAMADRPITYFVLWDYVPEFEKIDYIEGEDRRWCRWDTYIYKLKDRYFMFGYDHGLTEIQEDDFYGSDEEIQEVKPFRHEIVKLVTDWEPVINKNV